MSHEKRLSGVGMRALLCCVGILLISSCASTDKDAPIGVDARTAEVIKGSKMPYSQALAETVDRVKTGADDDDRVKIFKGSGIMVKGQTPWEPVPQPVTATPAKPAPTAPAPATKGGAVPAAQPQPATPPKPPVQSTPQPTPQAAPPAQPTPPLATTPTPPTQPPKTTPAQPATPPAASTGKGATSPTKGAAATTPAKTTTPPTKGAATPAAKPAQTPAATPAPATPASPGSRNRRGGVTTPPAATPATPAATPAAPATSGTPAAPAATTATPPATPPQPTPPAAQPPAAQPAQPRPAQPSSLPSARGGGNIVLNFEAADLREVIRNILGDILGEAYLIDPTVNGQVTIRTSSGIPRDALYATLETLLRMNNATMIQENGIYKILPAALGFKGSATPQLGNSQRPLPKGFSVQIVPLRYVSSKEMLKILEPFARDAQASMRGDDIRNLVILSGTELELQHLIETIQMFDIDWMSGMSVGLFKLRNVDVKGLAQDIQTAMAGDNGMGLMLGAVKFIPIERMNMLIAISPQPDQLDEIKKWIDKFDSDENTETPRLYVYALRYSRAEKLAPLLQQAFTGKNTAPTRVQQATTAPGTTGVTMGGGRLAGAGSSSSVARTTGTNSSYSRPTGSTGSYGSGSSYGSTRPGTTTARPGTTTGTTAAAGTANRPGAVPGRPGAPGAAGGGMGIAQDIQVVADEDNNAILIVATPSEYALAEQAIKKLDVPQRQVVIEVTMAEVTLTDNLSLGTQFWLKGDDKYNSQFTYGTGAGGTLDPANLVKGAFSLVVSRDKFNAFFTASSTSGNVKMVANPHIAALDNQEAHIEITQQIPYRNTIYNSGYYGDIGTNTSYNWQYVTPGVVVTVKPHINEGGNVSMEADIEFSAAGPQPAEDAPPPMTNRSVSSQLMVPSGSTMVIGGLIRDDKTTNANGIPLLSKIPVVGSLFGDQSWNNHRTELVIFLTPRVVDNEETRRSIIQDLRYRMDNLEGLLLDSKALPMDLIRRQRAREEKEDESM